MSKLSDAIGIGGPPIVACKTLRNFLYAMKQGIPTRVDRSIVRSLSGSVQGQLLATLRFFGFVSGDGTPTELLARVVSVEGEARERLLRDVLRRSYAFVFEGSFDLERGTTRELEQIFAEQNIGGERLLRAVALFLELAADAGFRLSRHMSRPKDKLRTLKRLSTRQPATKTSKPRSDGLTLLIAKIPELDAAWPDEIKVRWFDLVSDLANQMKPSCAVAE